MVNDGLVGARKHLHTLIGTRQHSLISGKGGRSRLTTLRFVLLRCHYLTARIEEVTRRGMRREVRGADLRFLLQRFLSLAPLGTDYNLPPPPPKTHTTARHTHTHRNTPEQTEQLRKHTHIPMQQTHASWQTATNLCATFSTSMHPRLPQQAYCSLSWTFDLLSRQAVLEIISEINAGKQTLSFSHTQTNKQARKLLIRCSLSISAWSDAPLSALYYAFIKYVATHACLSICFAHLMTFIMK